MEGHFSVQLAGGSPFRRILVDQTIDVTFNKDTKTTGIVTRFILKTGAVNKILPYGRVQVCFSRSADEISTSKVTSISPR